MVTKIVMQDLGNNEVAPAATPIATGAAPVQADPLTRLYEITTGGTGGDEVIDLQNFDLPLDDWANPFMIGQRVLFYLATQTDAGDRAKITVGGSGIIQIFNSFADFANGRQAYADGVILDYVGAMASFVWCGDKFMLDIAIVDGNNGSDVYAGSATTLQAGLNEGSPQDLRVLGADVPSGPTKGGIATVRGGNSADGEGGDLVLAPGNADSGTPGAIYIQALPTSDPHQQGQLWISAGALKVSAG